MRSRPSNSEAIGFGLATQNDLRGEFLSAGPKAIKNNMVTTPVKRSTKNQSCWVGEDIRVCAK